MNNITHVIRLKPNDDMKLSIQQFVHDNNILAGWIITCVGSLTQYGIRFANQSNSKSAMGYFEILSLTGTLSKNGCHLHITISDSNGDTTGGHLMEGCKVYTTAEIVIAQSKDFVFDRQQDGTWKELFILKTDGDKSWS